MSLDPDLAYQMCPRCKGAGLEPRCENERHCLRCDGECVVPHTCVPEEDDGPDEAARLLAHDDRLKASIARDAEVIGHFRTKLLEQGIDEKHVGRLLDTFYMDWLTPSE